MTKIHTKAITDMRTAEIMIRRKHKLAWVKPAGEEVIFVFYVGPNFFEDLAMVPAWQERHKKRREKHLNKSGHSNRGEDK